jgi:hypothetical protein
LQPQPQPLGRRQGGWGCWGAACWQKMQYLQLGHLQELFVLPLVLCDLQQQPGLQHEFATKPGKRMQQQGQQWERQPHWQWQPQ